MPKPLTPVQAVLYGGLTVGVLDGCGSIEAETSGGRDGAVSRERGSRGRHGATGARSGPRPSRCREWIRGAGGA